jgi:hypothetical protein
VTTGVRRYTAYGLAIDSAVALPELPASDAAAADAVVRLGRVDGVPAEARSEERFVRAEAGAAYLYLRRGAACCVRDGREIVVERDRRTDERVLRLQLLGTVLATLLRQRGYLILHASGVVLAGGAVAFLGGPGWGKSTVAAAFHAGGHALVDDDVLAVATDGDVPVTLPGVPRVKLYPEVAEHLGMDVAAMPALDPQVGKLGRAAAGRFAAGPVPLVGLYVLEDADDLAVEPLAAADALVEVLRHSYGARSIQAVVAPEHFRQCAAVARRVPARRLCRPRSLAALPSLVRAVTRDVAAAGAAGSP